MDLQEAEWILKNTPGEFNVAQDHIAYFEAKAFMDGHAAHEQKAKGLKEQIRLLKIQLCDKELKTLNLEHPLVKRNLALEMALKNILDNRHDDDKFWEAIAEAKRVFNGS